MNKAAPKLKLLLKTGIGGCSNTSRRIILAKSSGIGIQQGEVSVQGRSDKWWKATCPAAAGCGKGSGAV